MKTHSEAKQTSNNFKKTSLQEKFNFNFFQGRRWHAERELIKREVIRLRLGKHGIRPFGSTKALTKRGDVGGGARIKRKAAEENKKIPLMTVFIKVRKWFENERMHRQEVRRLHINQRLKYQLEADRDRQALLQQVEHPHFKPWLFRSIQERLATFQIHNESKVQRNWMDRAVLPRIGAINRCGERKSEKNPVEDSIKFSLTVAGCDYMIYLVAKGTSEELAIHVQEPEDFIKNRTRTVILVLDETPLWLKCRGEDQVFQSALEILNVAHRRRVKRQLRRANLASEKKSIQEDFEKWLAAEVPNQEDRELLNQWYHSGGDKHRLTLVNISYVGNWWRIEMQVEYGKDVMVFLVFCQTHCRLEDIDDDHKFNKTVVIDTTDGKIVYNKGDFTRLLWGYVEWRKRGNHERANKIRAWGQPCAWVDVQINIWLADLIQEVYGQSLLFSDCLTSRWSPPSMLAFWSNQVLMCPYAPDASVLVQEPDTHEHGPMKACIREVKSEMQFDLEQECKQQGKGKVTWGPAEYVEVCQQGLQKFIEKNPLVPIQGMIQNHILAVRPTLCEDGSIAIKLLDDCAEESTRALLAKPGLERYPPSRTINTSWCQCRDAIVRGWTDGKPPMPDWDRLAESNSTLVEDDLPRAPGPEDVELDISDFNDLELSDHQKLMLLPVETRISQIVYPKSIQARVMREQNKPWKNKSKWGDKLRGVFLGKLKSKWAIKVKKSGADAINEIKSKMGPVVTIKKFKRGRPKGKGKGRGKGKKKAADEAKPATASQLKTAEKLDSHEDLKSKVVIFDEAAGEMNHGRRGVVTSVYKVTEHTGLVWTKYVIMEDATRANQIHIDARFCKHASCFGTTQPLAPTIDWRVLKGQRLESIINLLGAASNPENLERVSPGTLSEHSTILAFQSEFRVPPFFN